MRLLLVLLALPTVVAAQRSENGIVARLATAPDERSFTGSVHAALAPDGRTIAMVDEDGRLELWDIAGKRLRTLATSGPIGSSPRWSLDGRRLFSGHERGVAVWDLANLDSPRVLPSRLVSSAGPEIAVSPNGQFVVATWPAPMIICWDLETGAERWRSNSSGALAVTSDGRRVIRGWFGQRFDFLDADGGEPVGRFGPDLLVCKPMCGDRFALSPDGRWIAAWEEKGVLVLRDASTGEVFRRLPTRQSFGSALAFSPDGHWLATGGDGHALLVWEIDTGMMVCRRAGHTRPLTTIDFTPDGQRIVTASGDLTALVWDLAVPAARGADSWPTLQSGSSHEAYAAIWSLARDAAGPDLLRAKLAPIPHLDGRDLDRLIVDLDAKRHAVRERASRALSDRGRSVRPALEAALGKARSAESYSRLERLIQAIPVHPTMEEIAHRRAVKAMSLSGTESAHALLREWAAGAPGAVLTDEAQRAVKQRAGR